MAEPTNLSGDGIRPWPRVAAVLQTFGRLAMTLLGIGTVLSLQADDALTNLSVDQLKTTAHGKVLAAGILVLLALPFARAAALSVDGRGRKIQGWLASSTILALFAFGVGLAFSGAFG